MLCKNILVNFLVSGVSNKNVIFDELLDESMRKIHVFIKQIFRAAEKAPLLPPPPECPA
jgi:hypothetical protein